MQFQDVAYVDIGQQHFAEWEDDAVYAEPTDFVAQQMRHHEFTEMDPTTESVHAESAAIIIDGKSGFTVTPQWRLCTWK